MMTSILHYMSRIMNAIDQLDPEIRSPDNDWAYWNLIDTLLYKVMPSRTCQLLIDVLGKDAYDKFRAFLADNKYPPKPVKEPNFKIIDNQLHKIIPITDDMDNEDLLKLSIEKWITIRGGLDDCPNLFDGAMRTCALCQRYIDKHCNGCPVKAKSGKAGCTDTPYDDYRTAITPSQYMKAACDEVVFLTELLLEQEAIRL